MPDCKDCPGPEVLKMRHESLVQKLNQLCEWRQHHEGDTKGYREKREVEEIAYRKEMYQNFNDLKSTIGKWAVGFLTSAILILVVQIVIMARQ